MEVALKVIATLSAAIFSGAALYISLVEHPVRLAIDAASAATEFRLSYRRAAPLQASSAALALFAGIGASLTTGVWSWAVAGVVIGAVIPLTLVVFVPTNRRLLGKTAQPDSELSMLLRRWGQLHWMRTTLGVVALIVMLWTANAP